MPNQLQTVHASQSHHSIVRTDHAIRADGLLQRIQRAFDPSPPMKWGSPHFAPWLPVPLLHPLLRMTSPSRDPGSAEGLVQQRCSHDNSRTNTFIS